MQLDCLDVYFIPAAVTQNITLIVVYLYLLAECSRIGTSIWPQLLHLSHSAPAVRIVLRPLQQQLRHLFPLRHVPASSGAAALRLFAGIAIVKSQ